MGYKNALVAADCPIRRRLKMRGTTDVIGIIALILLVLIFLRVFGII